MARFSNDSGDLHHFALDCLHAADRPSCSHPYTALPCDTCGAEAWEVAVEHHTGSKATDFRGVVYGLCTRCRETAVLFAFSGPHRRPVLTEYLVCPCGTATVSVGMCEREAGAHGTPGGKNAGVLVDKCTACARNAVVVWTD